MYRNLCCYCEGEVGSVGADQIEHRKPIEAFPELGFEWDNLHLACAGCNRAKSDTWSNRYSILDAVSDSPIARYLGYEESETGIRRTWHHPRGHTTVTDAKLNREALRVERMMVFGGVLRVIRSIRDRLETDPDDVEAANRRAELQEKCEGRYGTMIQWAIQNWLDPYV